MIVTVTALEPSTRLSIRTVDPTAAGKALGTDLPERIGARAVSDGSSALCLGPDEWVVELAGSAEIGQSDGSTAVSVVDVSDRELTLELAGPGVLDLLATGCPLDLARMPVGAGTRTIFDTVSVIITRETEDRFRLTAWRSFMPHVRALIELAERELALGI